MNRFHTSKTHFQVRGSLRHVGAGTATLALLVIAMLVAPQSARGQALTVLHTFAGGTDGASPSELSEDSEGNLYGITSSGGASNLGKVFKLDPTGKQSVLYSFAGGTDGVNPSSLMRDGSGNLYGTTAAGGVFGFGTIFSLDATGKESVLYSFPGGAGGATPGSVIRDGEGNLYGISSGGASNAGMVFKLSASGQASVLYSFPSSGLQGSPVAAALTLDSQGNLYGTTSGLSGACIYQGRLGTCGTVYKLDTAGNYTLLFVFRFYCCGNGAIPQGGLIRDAAGNLYGTTLVGGAYPFVYGTVFELPPSGSARVLHGFDGKDGANPVAGLIRDAAGNFYGTTSKGGAFGLGTVFRLTSGTETVLHSFTGGSDGKNPSSGLVLDAAGNLYGATPSGGASGYGTVFKLASGAGVGPLQVPNVVGETQATATTAIADAGLVVGTVTQQSSSTVASGDVISESPAAGTNVATSSAVNLVVSTGLVPSSAPSPLLAPSSLSFGNVLAGTISAPQSAMLTNIGNAPLKILSMTYNDNAPGGFWDVLYTTTCAPNLTIAPGSSCTFSIAFEANSNLSGPQPGSVIMNFAAGGSATLQLSANVIP
jgi:uncharacterized repeat protein (TIGR03803 family)